MAPPLHSNRGCKLVAPPRTLHIRCVSWAQVEAFYSRKLRRGRLLSMRVPFAPPIGAELTVGLELPTHMVLTIDGVVRKCEPSDAEARHWIEIELVGLSDELLTGLRDMVADSSRGEPGPAAEVPPAPPAPPAAPTAAPKGARGTATVAPPVSAPGRQAAPVTSPPAPAAVAAPPASGAGAVPHGEGQPEDERELFAALSAELRRLRLAAVHEVLGVSRDARAEEIRDGWMAHIRRFHPDVMARHRSLAVSHLAEELTILGNRAYDRLRVALVAEGRGAAFGPALFTPHGWLVGFDDLATSDVPAARALALRGASTSVPATSLPPVSGGSSGASSEPGFEPQPSSMAARTVESYEAAARELLAAGDSSAAREILAAALVSYPRSRPLRSLYYVASALTALAAGQLVLATSQLETALAHHEGCVEASLVLEQIHRNGATDYDALRRVFQ